MCHVQQFILQIKGIRVLGWPTFPAKISSSGARGCRQAISTMYPGSRDCKNFHQVKQKLCLRISSCLHKAKTAQPSWWSEVFVLGLLCSYLRPPNQRKAAVKKYVTCMYHYQLLCLPLFSVPWLMFVKGEQEFLVNLKGIVHGAFTCIYSQNFIFGLHDQFWQI